MYGIFSYICHKNQLNVGKYTSQMDGMGTEGKLNTLLAFRNFGLSLDNSDSTPPFSPPQKR